MNPSPESRKSSFPTLLVVIALVVGFAILLGLGLVSRLHAESERNETGEAQKTGAATVRTTRATKLTSSFDFSLPGTAEPLQDTVIYARTNGYLRERLADIGDQVKTGQLLARIDTPEINAQLNQARAALKQARAAEELAQATLRRQKDLVVRAVVSKQDFDNAQASGTQATANVAAAEAAVQNLVAQQGFNEVTAPFTGTITERNFDLGSLISNGSTTSLFRLSDVSTLRIYVNVPQTYAGSILVGQTVEISSPEGIKLSGQVARRAGAIDTASRTERVEVQIPNKEGTVLPGTYLNLKFKIAPGQPLVIVPSNALEIRRDGPRVAVLNKQGDAQILSYRPVAIGRDLGTSVELASGLNGDETLVLNPTSELTDGMKVIVAQEVKKS